MAKIYQIATVLYDVLKTVVPQSKIDEQVSLCCFCSNYQFSILFTL